VKDRVYYIVMTFSGLIFNVRAQVVILKDPIDSVPRHDAMHLRNVNERDSYL